MRSRFQDPDKELVIHLNPLLLQEVNALVQVLNLLHPHLSSVRLAQFLAGDNLEQLHEQHTVREVREQIHHLQSRLTI